MGDDCLNVGTDAAPALLADPAGRILDWLNTHLTGRWVLGLVGLPGSGKSTLAAQLEHEVNTRAGAPVMQALGMDGFHWSRATLATFPDPAAALARRGAPWTFDAAGLASRVRALRNAAGMQPVPVVAWPGFEHGVGDPVPDAIPVPGAARVLLVEGLYLLHQDHGWQLDGLLDECWYLDVDLDTAMERLVARHQASWALTRAQAEARLARNDRENAGIVLTTRPRAAWRVAPRPV